MTVYFELKDEESEIRSGIFSLRICRKLPGTGFPKPSIILVLTVLWSLVLERRDISDTTNRSHLSYHQKVHENSWIPLLCWLSNYKYRTQYLQNLSVVKKIKSSHSVIFWNNRINFAYLLLIQVGNGNNNNNKIRGM